MFVKVLVWVYFLIKCVGLLGCVLENVTGITNAADGIESAGSQFMRVLQESLPEFAWRIDTLKAVDYLLPQSRVRVFIRGMRRLVSLSVPPCLPPFGQRHLRECLGTLPHTPRSSYTLPQQSNLCEFEAVIKLKVARGQLTTEDVVVVSVDRSEDGAYNQCISVNKAPTLTTHNAYLVVLSVACVLQDIPDCDRVFFRKLADPERLLLQGLPKEMCLELPHGLAVFAAGNAYPVPLIIAALQPMLMALHSSLGNYFIFLFVPI